MKGSFVRKESGILLKIGALTCEKRNAYKVMPEDERIQLG